MVNNNVDTRFHVTDNPVCTQTHSTRRTHHVSMAQISLKKTYCNKCGHSNVQAIDIKMMRI